MVVVFVEPCFTSRTVCHIFVSGLLRYWKTGSARDEMIELAKRKSRFGLITILQDERKGSIVYLQAGFFQSEADRNGVSMVSYIHAIYDLLGQADSRKVLMIGCGGGTLATMLCKNGREVTVLDKVPQAFL